MSYIIYVCIIVVTVSIFILSFKLSQKINDKSLTVKAIKEQNYVVLTDSREFIQQGNEINKNAHKVIEKIRSLEKESSDKNSFWQQLNYKLIYVYGESAIKKFGILLIKSIIASISLVYIAEFSLVTVLVAGSIGGIFLGYFLLNRLFQRKIAHFLDNFVYAMDIIVRGLRAGLSSNHCFIQIVNDSDPVVSEQFLALVDDYKLGMTTEQVMNRFMKRMPLKEVSFFCLSVMIQSKTGGNLAEIIHNLSKILRNRKSILLKIQTLSSEAKSSAMIMGCLPIAIVLLLSFMAPEYMKILTHTESGKMVMACCAGWMGVGGLIMRSMINFYR